MSKTVITRTAEEPTFDVLHFSCWRKIVADFPLLDFETNVVISDLSQGAWKGHWISYELQLQLGIISNELVQPILDNEKYADTVGKLIDNESEGDRNLGLSLKLCQVITCKLHEQGINWVLIIPPKNGYDWEEENLQFIKLLNDALQGSAIKIILLQFPNANLPENWQLNYLNERHQDTIVSNQVFPFFPGIVEESIALELGCPTSFVQLRNGYVAINPTLKSEDWDKNDLVYLWGEKEYLLPIFQLRFAATIAPENIEKQALLRFAEGGYGIALRLLSLLLPTLKNSIHRESVRVQIQNIRIALLNFKDAANEEIVTDDLPEMIKASLYQSKAWGLVMMNKPIEAEPYFEKARLYLNEKAAPRLYLYLLNISALNKLRLGEINAAFSYEKRIEATLNKFKEPDWHVAYVNYINQARLYKKINDFAQSETYYDKAFAINAQLKNESDLLYTNLCYAQLEELKGNNTKAFIFYLRTCIHWLSNEMPEALAPRVAQAILYKTLSGKKGDVEKISRQLRLNLQNMSQKIGLAVKDVADDTFNFTRSTNTDLVPGLALGQLGWGVCISTKGITPQFTGHEYNTLKACVVAYIQLFFPTIKWDDYHTIITDTQFSCELPSTFTETLLVAWRLKINQIVFKDKTFLLTNNDLADFRNQIKVGISSAIDYIIYENTQMKVFFKRYKSAILLTGAETNIMQRLQEKESHVFNELGEADVLRNLEEKRLIQLFY